MTEDKAVLARLDRLDDRARNFVALFVETGDPVAAAKAAGYSHNTATHARTGLLRHAHIAYAIAMATRQMFAEDAPANVRMLQWLRDNSDSHKVRADCARALLDRAGYVAPRATIAPGKDEKPLHEQSTDELQTLAARLESELAGRAKPVSSATAAPQEDNSVDLIG